MTLRSVVFFYVIAAVAVLLGSYAWRHFVPPFAIIFFFLFICLVMVARRLSHGRIVVHNFAFIFLALGFSELFFLSNSQLVAPYTKTTFSANFFMTDPDLGYAIVPGDRMASSTGTAKDGSIVYTGRYEIDNHGFRKTKPESSHGAVFFFGDSFTFGEGVNDQDTLPQQFSMLAGHPAINFGVAGYGPHQMLRALELNRPEATGHINPLAVVYTALPRAHESRAAGRALHDQKGPLYELFNGEAKYVGRFDEQRSLSSRILSNSKVYLALRDSFFEKQRNQDRFLAIILKARKLCLEKYQQPFVVVLWDVHTKRGAGEWIAAKLRENDVPLLQLSMSLPALNSNDYYIPIDNHPNGRAYAMVARALNSFLEMNFPNLTTAKKEAGR
jgi:hypothetical protein